MPHDCLQIKILTKQPRWTYFFKSLFCSRYNRAHSIQKWGTWYFLQHSYERKSVCCMEEKNSSENLLFWGREVFRSQVLQTYFGVILIALSFDIMQDICRRSLLKCIYCWDPKLVPQTKKKGFFFVFSAQNISSGKKLRTFWNLIQPP